MAVDFLLDDNGDIDITNKLMTLTPDIQTSSRQQVMITLRTYLGEWVYNIIYGIPYLANDNNPIQLLGAGDNKDLVDLYVRQAILSRENIVALLSYTSSLVKEDRSMTISFQAETNEGEILTVTNQSIG